MAAVADKLTLADFESRYGLDNSRSYEFWFGDAIPKSMPTWIHGLLQSIVIRLLTDAGYTAASEVELRISPEARPKPDVIATKGKVEIPYPTQAIELAVEILSDDDRMSYVLEKFRAYQDWSIAFIYLVVPESRLVYRWTNSSLIPTELLATTPVAEIWTALAKALA